MPLFGKDCSCLRKPEEEVHVLDYSHSNLDYLPSEVFHYERTLEELYVNANGIRELPRELFYCHGLRKLSLCDNELKSIPPAVASLLHLEYLDISKNGIVDLPDSIKCCKHLSVVEASVNPLGKLPEGFTQLLNVTELYLNDTFLDFLPGSFGRLSKLRILEVRENHLKTLPKSLSRLTALERLDIGNNDFTELPNVIGGMTNLLELWCDCNQIRTIPSEVGNLKQLMFLDASKNRIEWLPAEIDGCINLADLHLSTNMLEQLPENIGRLCNLTTLKIDDNRLTSLPFSIGGLVSLSEMNISANDLEELPPSIGFLRHLRTLYADENFLYDLPPELGSCNGLTVLSLRSNNLKYIPDEIGRIPRLRVLTLSDNKIRCLPYSLTRLKELQALWLSENQNKPTIRLQPDIDVDTGQRMLTCYLLPQQPRDDEEDMYSDGDSFHPSLWEEEREQRQRIHFDFEDIPEEEEESKLQRHPTPYPKEMKFHAQHMRNLALKQSNLPNGEVSGTSPVSTPQKPQGPDQPVLGRRYSPERVSNKLGSQCNAIEGASAVEGATGSTQQVDEAADGRTASRGATASPGKAQPPALSPGKGSDGGRGDMDETDGGFQGPARRASTHSRGSTTHLAGSQSQLASSHSDRPHPAISGQRKIPPPPARPVMGSHFAKPPEAFSGPPSKPPSVVDLNANVTGAGSSQSHPANYQDFLQGLSHSSSNIPEDQKHNPIHMPYRRRSAGRGYESDTASGYRSDSAYMFQSRVPMFGREGYSSDIELATRGRGSHRARSGGYASDMEVYLQNNAKHRHVSSLPSQGTIHERKPTTNTYSNVPFSKKTMLRNDELYEQYRNSYPVRPTPQIISRNRGGGAQKPNDNGSSQSSLASQHRDPKSDPAKSEVNVSRSSSLNKGAGFGSGFTDSHSNGNNDDDLYKAQLYKASVKLQKTPSDKRPHMQIAMLSQSPSEKRRERPVGSERPRTPPPYQEAPAYGISAIQPTPQATPQRSDLPTQGPPRVPPAHQTNEQSAMSHGNMPQSPWQPGNMYHQQSRTNTPHKMPPTSQAPPVSQPPYYHSNPSTPRGQNSSSYRSTPGGSQQPPSRHYPYGVHPLTPQSKQGHENRAYNHHPPESDAAGGASSQYGLLTPLQQKPAQISHQNSPSKPPQQFYNEHHNNHPQNNAPRPPWLRESADPKDRNDMSRPGRLSLGASPASHGQQQISASQWDMPAQAGDKSQVDPNKVSQSLRDLHLGNDEYRMHPPSASSQRHLMAPHPSALGSGGTPLNTPLRLTQYDKDVAVFKQTEPPSQVSSSTDSGYVHNQVDSVCGTTPHRTDSQAPSPFRDSGVGNLYSRESTPGFSPSPHSTDISSEGPPEHKVSPHQFRVTISKNPGLGFSIAGGIGSPGNPFKVDDVGIFITKVQMPGPASTMLQSGDKIIEVDGIDFRQIDHDEAVSVLRKTTHSVCLLIERG